jgi:formate dehydrogenase iron-sulfur subunit
MRKRNALLIDITRCVGCGECTRACAEANNLPVEESKELSATQYTVLEEFNDGATFVRRLCMHCQEPTCASACLVGALVKADTGAVLYDESKCIGCRYCMQACPFEVPRYEWSSLSPRIQKCRMCHERVRAGGVTACSEACQFGSTMFGEYEEIVREACARIRENPYQYVDHIYGLTEVGGTSVLFLSGTPFEKLGFPTSIPHSPIPEISWRVLSQIPKYSVAASVVLFGIHWITARRIKVAKLEAEEREERKKREQSESLTP